MPRMSDLSAVAISVILPYTNHTAIQGNILLIRQKFVLPA